VIALTAYSAIDISRIMAESAGRGGWIPVIAASLVFGVMAVVITRLNNMYQGKALYDYSKKIVGDFFGVTISVFYILYFLSIEVFLNKKLVSILQAEFFQKTPDWALLALGIFVFGCIAYRGVTNIARFFEIICTVYLLTLFYVHITMLTQGIRFNTLPLFQSSDIPRYINAMKQTILPFLGIEALTVIPFNQRNGNKATATAFFSVIFVGFIYAVIVISCISVLGPDNIQYYSNPLIEAVRIVQNPMLQRFDILFLTVGFFGLISGISLTYLLIVEYTCKVFLRTKRIVIVIITGVITAVLCMIAFKLKNFDKMSRGVISAAGLLSAGGIPLILFFIAKVRNRGKENN
jgi:spore germination protein